MRSLLRFSCLLLLLLFARNASAQAHSVVLTWAAPSDAVASSTYNTYRAAGSCPSSGIGTLTWVKLNTSGITALTYTDASVAVGQYCYYATQVQNGVESNPSNTASALVRPNTVTITITLVM